MKRRSCCCRGRPRWAARLRVRPACEEVPAWRPRAVEAGVEAGQPGPAGRSAPRRRRRRRALPAALPPAPPVAQPDPCRRGRLKRSVTPVVRGSLTSPQGPSRCCGCRTEALLRTTGSACLVAGEASEAAFRVGPPAARVWARRATHEELRHGRCSERALTLSAVTGLSSRAALDVAAQRAFPCLNRRRTFHVLGGGLRCR